MDTRQMGSWGFKRVEEQLISNMMAASTRVQVLSLYRMMLIESKKFPSYNYRTYALRRVRDAFRANKKVEDPKTVERLMLEGQQTLALIQRQVSIGKMFETQRIVVENKPSA